MDKIGIGGNIQVGEKALQKEKLRDPVRLIS